MFSVSKWGILSLSGFKIWMDFVLSFFFIYDEVYSFIGSVFDPNVTGHVQKLKRMDPIDVETVRRC